MALRFGKPEWQIGLDFRTEIGQRIRASATQRGITDDEMVHEKYGVNMNKKYTTEARAEAAIPNICHKNGKRLFQTFKSRRVYGMFPNMFKL